MSRLAAPSPTAHLVSAAVTGVSGRARRSRVAHVWPALAFLVLVLGSWSIAAQFVNPVLISSPVATARALAWLLSHRLLWDAMGVSIREAAVGGVIGIALGGLLGVLMGQSRVLRSILMPFVNFMNATPLVVIIPLVVIWVGVDVRARILFIILISTWPMLLNSLNGVRNVAREFTDVGAAFDLSRRQIVTKILLPSAAPYFLTGIRLASALAIIGMIVSEIEVSFQGLGFLLTTFATNFEIDKLLATILITASLGLAIVGILKVVQRIFFPWITGLAAVS